MYGRVYGQLGFRRRPDTSLGMYDATRRQLGYQSSTTRPAQETWGDVMDHMEACERAVRDAQSNASASAERRSVAGCMPGACYSMHACFLHKKELWCK